MPRLDRLPQINRNNLLTFPARIACAKRPNRPTNENRGQGLR